MIMEQLVAQVLENVDSVKEIKLLAKHGVYGGRSYELVYSLTYQLSETVVELILGVPLTWDRKLIDVYVACYKEISYIPHMGYNGLLCLFDLEGVLIDKNLGGLIRQTIDRVGEVLQKGVSGDNRRGFILEFEDYWMRLPQIKPLKSMVVSSNEVKRINYVTNKRNPKRRKKETYAKYLKSMQEYMIACADSVEELKIYKDMKTIRNGLYIPIYSQEYVYPPDWREPLSIEFINELIGISLFKEDVIKELKDKKNEILLIFNIIQPDQIQSIIGIILRDYIIDPNNERLIVKQSDKAITPCWIMRCDQEYLMQRGGSNCNNLDKKVMLIGCGSIGGYLANELMHAGIKNLTLVDSDILKEENIYRHLLGMEYVGVYKSKALKEYFEKNIPYTKISCYESDIEEVLENGGIAFSEFDLIISAVGDHNLNRWINEQVFQYGIQIPVLYLWNEVLGIGSHGAILQQKFTGCYECFFDREQGILFDRTSYCEKGQKFSKKVFGCNSAFMPYASTTSLVTVNMGIQIVRELFEMGIYENRLVSTKGEDYYLKQAGYITSARYNTQGEVKRTLYGDKFKQERCPICGGC